MIDASGFKVWQAAVEPILYSHSLIRRAVSHRDPWHGDTVTAIVVLNTGTALEPKPPKTLPGRKIMWLPVKCHTLWILPEACQSR